MKSRTALTIAGNDCGRGAGIQANWKTRTMKDVYAMRERTVLTVQDTTGERAIREVDNE